METPPKEYTLEQVRTIHLEEANTLGWRCFFNEGQVKGDLNVSVLPPPTRVTYENKSRLYIYRRNPLTGHYHLARKIG